jgi:hypothetical protein
MDKLDMKKEYIFYKAKESKIDILEIPKLNYLKIDGIGSPSNIDYQNSIEALYTIAYTIKFTLKNDGKDFVVMPLEGLWYADHMSDFEEDNKDNWKWTSMILMPDFVTKEIFEIAKIKAQEKKIDNKKINEVRLELLEENTVAQTLYMGPYNKEHETIMNIHEHIKKSGYILSGLHHEIYLNDPRKVSSDKLKTIIRQPFSNK